MSEIWVYVAMVFAPFLLMAGLGVAAYILNVKLRAFFKKGAVIRIVDDATRQEKSEAVGEYNESKGWARFKGKAWKVDKQDVLYAFPNIPIVHVSASKARSINLTGQNSEKDYSPETLESAIISVGIAMRRRAEQMIKNMATMITLNTALAVVILIFLIFTFLQFDPVLKKMDVQEAEINAIKNILNSTAQGSRIR